MMQQLQITNPQQLRNIQRISGEATNRPVGAFPTPAQLRKFHEDPEMELMYRAGGKLTNIDGKPGFTDSFGGQYPDLSSALQGWGKNLMNVDERAVDPRSRGNVVLWRNPKGAMQYGWLPRGDNAARLAMQRSMGEMAPPPSWAGSEAPTLMPANLAEAPSYFDWGRQVAVNGRSDAAQPAINPLQP